MEKYLTETPMLDFSSPAIHALIERREPARNDGFFDRLNCRAEARQSACRFASR